MPDPQAAPGPTPVALSERAFRRVQALVRRESGIHLTDAKRALVVSRLARRVRELGLHGLDPYVRRAEDEPAERQRLLDAIATNETHFFREPRQFAFLREQVFPRWVEQAALGRRPRRARVWSAACSTGEEPTSLAMTLLAHFPPACGWEIDILASDISLRALERARAATWPLAKAQEIPGPLLRRWMRRGFASHEGEMRACAELRATVRYERVNLHGGPLPPGPFDLIFCRNVLIYFEAAAKAAVVERLLDRLLPDGLLFLGHAESLSGLTGRARSVGPTVYRSRPVAPAAAP
ncbi:MAG TPA: protein-glutamate O-methyltransferase CheR [Vicinamibacteria bacterium]|nr:protein-glutamate O-methyltransferase CheR [Vicinamibacteria bacterium]